MVDSNGARSPTSPHASRHSSARSPGRSPTPAGSTRPPTSCTPGRRRRDSLSALGQTPYIGLTTSRGSRAPATCSRSASAPTTTSSAFSPAGCLTGSGATHLQERTNEMTAADARPRPACAIAIAIGSPWSPSPMSPNAGCPGRSGGSAPAPGSRPAVTRRAGLRAPGRSRSDRLYRSSRSRRWSRR